MPKKACIIWCDSDEAAQALALKLPPDVRLAGKQRVFDRNIIEVRLEGDGLPEMFKTQPGQSYRRAALDELGFRLVG